MRTTYTYITQYAYYYVEFAFRPCADAQQCIMNPNLYIYTYTNTTHATKQDYTRFTQKPTYKPQPKKLQRGKDAYQNTLAHHSARQRWLSIEAGDASPSVPCTTQEPGRRKLLADSFISDSLQKSKQGTGKKNGKHKQK